MVRICTTILKPTETLGCESLTRSWVSLIAILFLGHDERLWHISLKWCFRQCSPNLQYPYLSWLQAFSSILLFFSFFWKKKYVVFLCVIEAFFSLAAAPAADIASSIYDSLILSLNEWPFSSSKRLHSQTVRASELIFDKMFNSSTTCHMSRVICYMYFCILLFSSSSS